MIWHKTIDNNKPRLILLHGWAFNADIFASILPKLSVKYCLTLIDLPGHGRSDFVEGNLDNWISAILPLIPKNADIAGWSLGGLVAIKLAQLTEAKSLHLIASAPCLVNRKGWEYVIDKNNFAAFFQTLNSNVLTSLKNFIKLQLVGPKHLKIIYNSIEKHPASTQALKQGLDILQTTDLRTKLISLASITNVILGQKDTLISAKIAHWFNRQKIKTTILETGHLPFLHPDFSL